MENQGAKRAGRGRGRGGGGHSIKARRGALSPPEQSKPKKHRGTRGRGDIRNASMKIERLQKALQRQDQQLTGLVAAREKQSFAVNTNTSPAPEKMEIELQVQRPRNPTFRGRGTYSPRFKPQSHNNRAANMSHSSSRPSSTSLVESSSSRNAAAASSVVPRWTTWDTVAILLFNVPEQVNTYHIWQALSGEGRLFSIDLYENSRARRTGKGKARFRPPPRTDFWRTGTYQLAISEGDEVTVRVQLDLQNRQFQVPSPVQPNVHYPAEIVVPIHGFNVGILENMTTMLSLRSIGIGLQDLPRVVLDLRRRELVILFQLTIFNSRRDSTATKDSIHEYRLRVPFTQLSRVLQTKIGSSDMSHVITLAAPAIYHRRIKDLSSTFAESGSSWRDADTWFRQTDIVHVPEELTGLPISLKKFKAIINIGRWNTIRINYPEKQEGSNFELMCRALRDFNINMDTLDDFNLNDPKTHHMPVVWDIVDPPEIDDTSSLHELIGDGFIHLPFSVRYQLEVCLSHGFINEYSAGKEFIETLVSMGEKKAKKLLEYIASQKKIYYEAMDIFKHKFVRGVTTARIPPYCCYMCSATVTPSTVYFNTPSVDTSNRVIRRFIEYSDRFLRVRFTDEKMEGRINSTERNTMDEVFTRVKRTMSNGIKLGDRHYEFLAFGNSQFREHGAYFFASLPNLTAANIRAWMGQFSEIRNIAKYAARLGQCFSTTRAVTGCSVRVQEIKDVVRNGYTFSDGVGRMSKFLAQMAASELKIKTPDREPPSAFQFRLGGCKGMLVVSSEARGQEIHIRPSQQKFPAGHIGLEVIRWSQVSMATLNRQLIVVLSSLGVADNIFHNKLNLMLANLDAAMTEEIHAIHLLEKYIDPNQMTLLISQMVKDGFQKSKDPFVTSLLTLWRAWQIKYLKEKAKIVIEKGACLLGVMDETATLKGYMEQNQSSHNASYEEKVAALPEIFVQIYRPDQARYQVIEGVCILARNPSLHPGDIRVVKAVNVLQLSHIKDTVVLPQLGDRDISSMCSGGDLDGDDYLVIWDEDMLPKDWFRTPFDYFAVKSVDLNRPVTVNDITSFFVQYMKNDCLPRIAHAHLAWADYLPNGVEENKCIRLAQLHSDAVDYNKTGNPARMTQDLRPRMWPHFMEKKHQPKERIYKSQKILGQLYDSVERVDFVPNHRMPFDNRVLSCSIYVREELSQFARQQKYTYDLAVRRIMAQHEIETEFEVWSTFVLSHANMSKDYKFHEELGGISSALRDRFRKECYEHVGGRDFEQLAPLVVAMYTITYEEVTVALEELHKDSPDKSESVRKPMSSPDKFPLISFPWIFPEILGKIAMRHYDETDEALTATTIKEDSCQDYSQQASSDQATPSSSSFSSEAKTEDKISTPAELQELQDGQEIVEEGEVQSALDVLTAMLDDED